MFILLRSQVGNLHPSRLLPLDNHHRILPNLLVSYTDEMIQLLSSLLSYPFRYYHGYHKCRYGLLCIFGSPHDFLHNCTCDDDDNNNSDDDNNNDDNNDGNDDGDDDDDNIVYLTSILNFPTGQPSMQPSMQPSCQPTSYPTQPSGMYIYIYVCMNMRVYIYIYIYIYIFTIW
jgi:hypothetical protein